MKLQKTETIFLKAPRYYAPLHLTRPDPTIDPKDGSSTIGLEMATTVTESIKMTDGSDRSGRTIFSSENVTNGSHALFPKNNSLLLHMQHIHALTCEKAAAEATRERAKATFIVMTRVI